MKKVSIGISCDHAGFEFKEKLKTDLIEEKFAVKDYGTYSSDSVDYPDFAHPLAQAVENKEHEFGITLCGSGNGINMTVNKHKNIRAALCWNIEISELARQHNDANVCSLPARFIDYGLAKEIVFKFLNTEFEGGRHLKRVQKIPIY